MKEQVLAWLAAPDRLADERTFDAAARALHAWQVARCPDLAALQVGPAPAHWTEIPAVPVALYRDLELCCFPVEQGRVLFQTSGTTSGRRGSHHLLDTDAYDLGARLWAERVLGPLPQRAISLVAPSPSSSLHHMIDRFCPGSVSFASADGIDVLGALGALRTAAQDALPVFLPGTAFAFAELVAATAPTVRLPEGSILMVTGGYKGRIRTVSEADLDRLLGVLLPGTRRVGEYGMTELSSQLWSDPLGAAFRPPPWMRVRAVDPWTGAALPPGEVGLLCFVDLLNHQSNLCVETEDLGTVAADGAVSLRGRLEGAVARGCSLSVEEALLR